MCRWFLQCSTDGSEEIQFECESAEILLLDFSTASSWSIMIWVVIVGYFMHLKIIQDGFRDTDNDICDICLQVCSQ